MTLSSDLLVPRRPGSPNRERTGGRFWPLALLFALGTAVILAGSLGSATAPAASTGVTASAWQGAYAIPSRAVDGELLIVIPPGTAEVMAAGGDGYLMPAVIDLKVGDTIAIRNEDTSPHIMMFAFIMPGETIERTFDKPLTETYSAGCTISPSPVGFTSLFVSDH